MEPILSACSKPFGMPVLRLRVCLYACVRECMCAMCIALFFSKINCYISQFPFWIILNNLYG